MSFHAAAFNLPAADTILSSDIVMRGVVVVAMQALAPRGFPVVLDNSLKRMP